MDEGTPAEERLLETVETFIRNYRPGWSEIPKPTRADFWAKSVMVPVALVALAFLVTQSGWAPYRSAGGVPHHASYCLLVISVALGRASGGRWGALVAVTLSVMGLIEFAPHSFDGSSGAGWLIEMAASFFAAGFAVDIGGRASFRSGPPHPPQHALDQGNRLRVVNHRPTSHLAFH